MTLERNARLDRLEMLFKHALKAGVDLLVTGTVVVGCSTATSGERIVLSQDIPHWGASLSGAKRWQAVFGGVAVLDKETGLVWERAVDTRPPDAGGPEPKRWSDAFAHCVTRQVGGKWGWRLPEAHELGTLLASAPVTLLGGERVHLPEGQPFHFAPGSKGFAFWSATSNVWTEARYEPAYLDLATGVVGFSPPNAPKHVLCVRGGGVSSAR